MSATKDFLINENGDPEKISEYINRHIKILSSDIANFAAISVFYSNYEKSVMLRLIKRHIDNVIDNLKSGE